MNSPTIHSATRDPESPASPSASEGGTDREFLDRFVANRDEVAFAALVERHGPMVLEVCRRVLQDVHEAEDACQATFLVLARKAGSLRRPELLANWLHGVAYRTALKTQRETNRYRAHAAKGAAMQATDATAELVWNDLRPILDEELDRLPIKCRGAVVLCYLEGLKVEMAAQHLGCPRGTVLSRLARARELLRTRLAKRGLVFPAGFLGLLLARKAPASISLPSAFVEATVKAACAFAVVRSAPTTGMALRPSKTARGVLTAMLLAKLKLGVAWVLVASVVLVGAAIAIRHGIVASFRNPGAPAEDMQEPGEEQACREDLARLQGTWRQVEYVDAHGKAPPDQIKEYRWIIDGDGFTMVGCHADPQRPEPMKNALGNVMQFRFQLDAGKRPKSMDISVDGSPCYVAIYELNGDTLRVCTAKTGSPRPTRFVPEGDTIVWVFLAEGKKPLPDK